MNILTAARAPFQNRFSIVYALLAFFLCLSFLTRVVLLVTVMGTGIPISDGIGAFLIGSVYDLMIGILIVIPILLQLVFQCDFFYQKKVFNFVFAIGILVIFIFAFTDIVPRDFSPELHTAFIAYLCLRLVIYTVLYLRPVSSRITWRKGTLYFSISLIIFCLLLNAASEWFFWNEFSSRYNFIAVDYLVYTHEVFGNIRESYPIFWILAGLSVVCAAILLTLRRNISASVLRPMAFGRTIIIVISFFAAGVLGLLTVKQGLRHFSRDEYANSLAGNGIYEFAVAYQQNELNFTKYYATIPNEEAFNIVRKDLAAPNIKFVSDDSFSIERDVSFAGPDRNLNVVLISVESLSAEYMAAFGNTSNITPALDSLIPYSLFFSNLYASGNRTVRGLEALALSIPPTPGQSTVKRQDNSNLFSIGSVLNSRGYHTQYIYGGDSYFDNMRTFFSGNGYTVVDREAIPEAQVHYQNVWGVADEDLFDLALRKFDENAALRAPFFGQVMTVSNHRPYTYPEGRIDISPKTKTRYGAVKYTDYAIGRFLRMAAKKPWFNKTIFVIVSDHCAGSAGNVELPVTGYHIPMLIYAPGIVEPGKFEAIAAQVDIAPTILGLLNKNYRSKFFGQDLLNMDSSKHKAFISTYQGLGYLQNGDLVIQSPIKKISQYRPDFKTGAAEHVPLDSAIGKKAIAYYQCANWLLKNKKQNSK
jgi:phosphoglycerol transferase MdoB-like AlkP superfamily enzyme